MARYSCPQCGRGFGSVGEVLSHTQQVHATAEPYSELGSASAEPARGMPSAEPGPVATERAAEADFEIEPAGGNGGGPFGAPGDAGEGEEKQNPAIGTVISVVVIALIIIFNLLFGGESE